MRLGGPEPGLLAGRGRLTSELRRGERRTPWREARYCVVDLELSGLDPSTDEIISFGAVPIDGGLIAAGRSLYGLARPTRPLPEASVVVHGIRTVDLEQAPPLDESIVPLLEAMTGRVLVAHSAGVERAFLGAALAPSGCQAPRAGARYGRAGAPLDGRAGRPATEVRVSRPAGRAMGLPEHRPHHALSDALTTAQVFLAVVSHLEELSPETVGSLSRADARLDNARHYSPKPAVS